MNCRGLTILLSPLAIAACTTTPTAQQMSLPRAIDLVLTHEKDIATELQAGLPPASLEARSASGGGWEIAILRWGSGRPGVLAAECFHVDQHEVVRRSGRFVPDEGTTYQLDLRTCTGVFETTRPRPGQGG